MLMDTGVSDARISELESSLNFKFPNDLRDILSNFVPRGIKEINNSFPDWNNESIESLQKRFDWFTEGVFFDIKNNGFWYGKWGEEPENISKKIEIAKEKLLLEPKPIPICGHRCVLGIVNCDSSPVLSIWQTDIIYYGSDIMEYFVNEFEGFKLKVNTSDLRFKKENFWSDVIEGKGLKYSDPVP